jgi:hypothetical protein
MYISLSELDAYRQEPFRKTNVSVNNGTQLRSDDRPRVERVFLPSPSLEHLRLVHPRHGQTLHRSRQIFTDFK